MKAKRVSALVYIIPAVILLAFLIFLFTQSKGIPPQEIQSRKSEVTSQENRFLFQSGAGNLLVEFLDDDLVHFELSRPDYVAELNEPIFSTIMVRKTDYAGASALDFDGVSTMQTSELKVEVDPDSLCVTISDLSREPDLTLTSLCPYRFDQDFKGFSFTPESFTNAYGLGEKFLDPNTSAGDWVGESRFPGDYGNVQEGFNDGAVGNDQFPVLYLTGRDDDSYLLFLDNAYRQFWDLSGAPWKVSMDGEAIRFYVMSGPDLMDLRADFMELVGKPPVPPKPAFGLWISEYGFDNWAELEDKLTTLRENNFPVDGFVLDGQWYGGIVANTDDTPVGSLTWDEANFPNPQEFISNLEEEQGVRLIAIEQPYIGKNLPEHEQMAEQGYLVEKCEGCEPVYLTSNPWWGQGGMIDFSDPDGVSFWHDWKREALIADGLLGHWTDLGEPELFSPSGYYTGVYDGNVLEHDHNSIHNLYNLLWSRSIFEGYQENEHEQRPFILSRSGTAGSQRYGVVMWSGDISSRLSSLAAHLRVQSNMSFSGVDYYGADIGGFWRVDNDPTESYTQWFADGAALDVPVRSHAFNLCNCYETAPDRIGDLDSNLNNIRQRYALIPYMYSLAHRANLGGEPVIAPLVYYFQQDEALRGINDEKMVGPYLLVKAIAQDGQRDAGVYLPAGTWIDIHSGEWIESAGESTAPMPLYPDGIFQLPAFARAGAIIPRMFVDELTMNAMGKRLDGSRRDELLLDVYASEEASEFTLYEDDGLTIAYQRDELRTTRINQQLDEDTELITIEAAQGAYAGALSERNIVISLYLDGAEAASVLLNGGELALLESLEEFETADAGWYGEAGKVLIKTGVLSINESKELEIKLFN